MFNKRIHFYKKEFERKNIAAKFIRVKHYFLNKYVANDHSVIEEFSKQYASVVTDLETGREGWLTKGSVLEAVWSSISLPGLFPAIKNNNKWLVDGGLVNPVPVSVCRALGAEMVIAVNLNGDIAGKHFQEQKLKINRRVYLKLSLVQLILRRIELRGAVWLGIRLLFYFLQNYPILAYWSFIEQMKR